MSICSNWSIGIYTGASPFHLEPAPAARNPVLTKDDIHDVPAVFVADPFMISVAGVWYMFFEIVNQQTDQGEIGLATSNDGLVWRYQHVVLSEDFHLSYPYVFEWQSRFYMIPETLAAGAVRLYQARSFPEQWSYAGTLFEGAYADPSIFRFADRWWMFVCSNPYDSDELRLFLADELNGPWKEHPKSPIVAGNKHAARPAGRITVFDNTIVRYSQDCVPRYGSQVRAFKITQLTSSDYCEAEYNGNPILTGAEVGWNSIGMHHIDPHLMPDGKWIACVDGFDVVTAELAGV